MSSTKFAQFSLFIGLNLINPLYSIDPIQPAHRYADKLEGSPAGEFYDILKFEESFYLAGSGLIRVQNGEAEALEATGRYTALCHEEGTGRIWFAGSEGIGVFGHESGEMEILPVNAGYIWDILLVRNRLWYFGSQGYGWIDTVKHRMGAYWNEKFTPRPMVFCPRCDGGYTLFVSDERGLHRVTGSGLKMAIPESVMGGQPISWLVGKPGDYHLGTVEDIYTWTGTEGSFPISIDSNYGEFFKKGLSNAIRIGDEIAITDYPYGVAIWDIATHKIDGYSDSSSGLDIGDVFKSSFSEPDLLMVLGTGGIATVDMGSPHRFIPAVDLWDDETYRGVITQGGDGLVFSDGHLMRISGDLVYREPLRGNPLWIALDPDGNVAIGDVNSYEVHDGKKWHQELLTEPLFELSWGRQSGYAVGQDGLYSISKELELELVYPSDGRLYLIGELEGILYIRDKDGSILKLESTGHHWIEKEHPGWLEGPPIHTLVEENRILVSTESGLYALDGNDIHPLALDSGWVIRGLGKSLGTAYAALYNPDLAESAIGIYQAEASRILMVPYLSRIGEPRDLVCTGNRIGVVGDNGMGWYVLDILKEIKQPMVTFDLLSENTKVDNRTLGSGMHFIDLQIHDQNPGISKRIQYRINEQRWRNVDIKDPSLQFTGHGNFSVELRAVHPNGISTSTQRIQFGIGPPWYFNPVYQVLLLVLAILFVWGIYILRHRQLKKTNLWLESEVRKQTRELQTATEARTNFLAGLSHDIRNPLNGVLMIAEALSRDPPHSPEDSRLADLKEFGIIVDRMLGEILDFSAIDQTNVPTTFIPVALADILRSSITQNQFSIQREMINMQMSIPPELESIVIKADRNWMIKILANLIINAISYSESERIEVGARNFYLTDKEVDLEIFVKDWGCGIDDSEKHLVFDRFYRGERGIESGRHGTGLGLSICQDIAHAMGAHLLLEDNEPSGSVFILRGRFERIQEAVELDVDAVLATLRGKKVLVVDDLAYNRHSIVDFLVTIGCQCDQSGNGREALDMLGNTAYDLALLDWDLPGMMGPDIARAHRKDHPEDKVILIALTAYTEADKKNLSEKAGMNGYISKPLTASRLAYSLANVTDHHPGKAVNTDRINQDELLVEVHKHIEECIHLGESYEWEELRRCAHRLTTLALSLDNKSMQQVCRDLQIAAQSENLDNIHIGLADLRQWRDL